MPKPMLTTTDHRRDSAGLTYVYPVVSRRSGGLSIGINLNPNNACNWRCIYCQVPDLQRGAAPQTDLELLRRELREFIGNVQHGDFFQRFQVPPEHRAIRDIALSGNGEPTSAPEFDKVVKLISAVGDEFGLLGKIKWVLISNGSLLRRPRVQRGLLGWRELGGEIWFKLDSATEAGVRRINGISCSPSSVMNSLETAAKLCPTWIQTCLFALDGQPPSEAETQAYRGFIEQALGRGIALQGVLLYGLARPSMQAEAPRLSPLRAEWMEAFAANIRDLGLEVRLSF